MKSGNRASIENLKALQVSKARRGPYRFALPGNLWNKQEDKGFSIVKGGTPAMVFKIPANQLYEFIQQNVNGTQLGRIWTRFQNNAKAWEQELQRQRQRAPDTDGSEVYLYLKVRTKDTAVRFKQGFKNIWSEIALNVNDPGITISETEKEACQEFLKTYIIEPYEDANFSLSVMADRG